MSQNDIIEKMYKEGASRKEIAKATGLTPQQAQYRIYKILELNLKYPRKNFAPKSKALDRNTINRIIMLTSWGYRDKEIAEDQGVHPSLVRQVIEENLHRIVKKV